MGSRAGLLVRGRDVLHWTREVNLTFPFLFARDNLTIGAPDYPHNVPVIEVRLFGVQWPAAHCAHRRRIPVATPAATLGISQQVAEVFWQNGVCGEPCRGQGLAPGFGAFPGQCASVSVGGRVRAVGGRVGVEQVGQLECVGDVVEQRTLLGCPRRAQDADGGEGCEVVHDAHCASRRSGGNEVGDLGF